MSYFFSLIISSPIFMFFNWYICITTCYQELPLVTCKMNSLRRSSTRALSSILLTRKRLPIVANSWCHIHVNLTLPSSNLFQNVTFDGCVVDWIQWNKGWSILLWSSCRRALCNILEYGFCALGVVLQWKYILFTLLLELRKVIIHHWNTYGFTYW